MARDKIMKFNAKFNSLRKRKKYISSERYLAELELLKKEIETLINSEDFSKKHAEETFELSYFFLPN